jgi:hypothetical protein
MNLPGKLHQKLHQKIINSLLVQIPAGIQYDIISNSDAIVHGATMSYFQFRLGTMDPAQLKIKSPNCIVLNFDILEIDEYDHTVQAITSFSQNFLQMVDTYPDTKFVLMCLVENAQKELTHDRIDVVRFGNGILNDHTSYETLLPEIKKNFNSKKNFICLNRHPRQYRINLVSYLLALNLEQHGTISFHKENAMATNWLERVSWNLNDDQIKNVKSLLMDGYDKLKNLNLECSLNEVDQIYSKDITTFNAKNFDLHLRSMYQNHFVEIVAETQFNVPFYGTSEKFRNAVYGCVFPILLGGVGIVDFLRKIGFDMFDDVVDHSYDSIIDPLDRLCAAVDLNRSLLTNNEQIKILWEKNQSRFLKNIEFIKTKFVEMIEKRANDDFQKIKWNA